MERTALYRFFDDSDTLLYIGITNDTGVRWLYHARHKAWWNEVATKTVSWYDTRLEAAHAEATAIVAESPKYNIVIPDPEGRYPFAAGATRKTRGETPIRSVGIPDDIWDGLAAAAKIGNTTRGKLVNELVRWYLDEYGPTPPMPTVPHLPVPPRPSE
jgi:predicted GIY-YIG superfamily endonuclease